MKRTLIAVFLGWAGGYQFYQRKWLMGIIYLFTLGLFGFGWLLDIIKAVSADIRYNKPVVVNCEIRGTFAESKRNPKIKRKDILAEVPVGADLSIESASYKGAPFYLVCTEDGRDIGAVPSEINSELRGVAGDIRISAKLIDKDDLECPHMRLEIRRK